MAVLGAIEIQMLADLSRLRQDMNQAKGIVGEAARGMQSAVDTVGKAFNALGVGLSVAAFGSWIKSAIDAGDEANKLAQKTGLATDKIAGLTLAFQQSGAGGVDVLQKSMSKLSSELVAGNKTLEALGITTKDTREALGQIADKFAAMSDGTAKAAAAVGIWGERMGANMIPLLNAGSQGLQEMDDMARKLGLTIGGETGQAAEKFNDTLQLVGLAMKGMATQAAAQLLPSMNALAGAFLETFTEGGRLQAGVQVLDAGMKILFTTVAAGVEAFNTLGKVIGGIGAAGAQLVLEGDRAGAAEALKAMGEDIKKGWVNTADMVRKAWDGSASAVAEKSAEMAKRQREAALAADELMRKMLEQGEAAKKAAKALADAAQKERELMASRDLKALAAYDKAEAEIEEQLRKTIQAEKELMAVRELRAMANYDAAEAAAQKKYEDEVEAARKANEQILADWQRTVDQMGQALVDALMAGGKSVAEYLKGLFRTVVLRPVLMPSATALSSFISGPASAMGGGGGLGGLGGFGGGLGGLAGSIGSLGTFASIGLQGTLGGAGLGSMFGASGAVMANGSMLGGAAMSVGAMVPYVAAVLAALKVSGSLYDKGWSSDSLSVKNPLTSLTAAETGLLKGLGINNKWANMLTGAPVVAKLFGRKAAESEDAGIEGSFGAGGFSGQSYNAWVQKGGVFRSDKRGTERTALLAEVDSVFDAGAQAMTAQLRSYADVLGLPVKAVDSYTQKIKLSLKGMDDQQVQEAIAGAVADFGEGMAARFSAALAPFQKAGETMVQTLERLADLQQFSDHLNDLGGVFSRVAALSVKARESFIEMAGGMDALGQKAMQFVQDYYSRDEIAGLKANEIQDALAAVGITQDIGSREEFRALVDGVNVNTETGQQQLAALLDMASAFTSVADYLAETGTTLAGASALAPTTGATAALFAPGGQGEQVLAINGVAMWTEAVFNAIKELTGIVAGNSSFAGALPYVYVPAPEVNGGLGIGATGGGA